MQGATTTRVGLMATEHANHAGMVCRVRRFPTFSLVTRHFPPSTVCACLLSVPAALYHTRARAARVTPTLPTSLAAPSGEREKGGGEGRHR